MEKNLFKHKSEKLFKWTGVRWLITLEKDTLNRSQLIQPDWYGYWRIDKF